MLRSSRLSIAVAALAGIAATPAAANPPASVERWYGDSSSATGAALGHGPCDVNGDGFDDAVVGGWFWDKSPNSNVGAAYVLLGNDEPAGGDLNTPASAGAVRIDGPQVNNRFVGFSVACAGDVNGDDYDDIVISDYVGDQAYVIVGAEDFGPVDLAALGGQGFVIKGPAGSNFSFGSYAAGDVNGDSFDDLAISGVVADTRGRTNNGAVWIVAGKEGFADVDVTDPGEGEVLATVSGPRSEDRLGAVSAAGDVDGDGTDDLVMGAYVSEPYGSAVAASGMAWMISGEVRGDVDTADLDPGDGFEIWGPDRQRDRLGISVAGAGDVDGDGLDDLLVGGDGVSNAATGERDGGAWVVFGSESPAPVYTDASGDNPTVYECADEAYVPGATCAAPATRGYRINGADTETGTSSESAGYSLDAIGDVNGDGRPDAAIGSYGYDPVNPASPPATMTGAGAVFVVYGQEEASTIELGGLTAQQGYRIDGLSNGDRFGRQLGALGDFDGNGMPDWSAAGDFAQRPLPPGTPRSQAGEVAVALMPTLATETALSSSDPQVTEDDEVTLTAEVDGADFGVAVSDGEVAFTADGDGIPGCGAVAVDAGVAKCTTTFADPGSYEIGAAYSSQGRWSDSGATTITQQVDARPVPPSARAADGRIEMVNGRAAVAEVECPADWGACTASGETSRVEVDGRRYGARLEVPPAIEAGATADVILAVGKPGRKALRREGRGSVSITVETSSAQAGSGEPLEADLVIRKRG